MSEKSPGSCNAEIALDWRFIADLHDAKTGRVFGNGRAISESPYTYLTAQKKKRD